MYAGAALALAAAGMTQVDAAEATGYGQPYLSSLEGGKFGSSLTRALRILRFVGCEVIVKTEDASRLTGNGMLAALGRDCGLNGIGHGPFEKNGVDLALGDGGEEGGMLIGQAVKRPGRGAV